MFGKKRLDLLAVVLSLVVLALLLTQPALSARRRTKFPTRRPTKRPTLTPTRSSKRLALLIPAYFYPTFLGSPWSKMTQLAEQGVNITAVMNNDNGPGTSSNSDYVSAVTAFKAKGGKLFGYVYSCYGRDLCVKPGEKRNVSVMVHDALLYDEFYGPLHGIFIDELSSSLNEYAFYRNFSEQLRVVRPQWKLMANPGTPCPEEYLNLFDILLTRETGPNAVVPAATWAHNYPADRQSYLYYGVSTEAIMRAKVAEARARNVGYIYVTHDVLPNPWDTLAKYIDKLVAEL